MAETYVTMRIKEALAAAQGSRGQAQRLLMQWAMQDEQLLAGLTRPFLKAIVGSAIQRVSRGMPATAEPPARRPTAPAGKPAITQEQLDSVLSKLSTRRADLPPILNGAPPPKAEGTQKQAAGVRALAKAFAQKRF
ncbi:MAG TPA: hypothetical protein VED40_15080 [Azospirillaceae bacterium]|nr:hypothetical protein [Azospirillaceae bacterium]